MKNTHNIQEKKLYSGLPQSLGNSKEDLVNLPISQLLERLNTSPTGLSSEEASTRLGIHGYNEFAKRKKKTALFEFVSHLE